MTSLRSKNRSAGKTIRGGLAVLALVVTSGCSGVSGALSGCSDADESVAAGVMEQTETNFQVGPDPRNIVSKVEYVRAKTIDLPEDLREFGAEKLLSVRVKVFFGDLVGSGFNGTEDGGQFALSADGDVIGPADVSATDLFVVPAPQDPAWDGYVKELESSKTSDDLFSCSDGG